MGGDAESGSVCSSPALAAVRTECPERAVGGGLVTLSCSWTGGEGFSSLVGQTCRPRERVLEEGGKKGAWGCTEEKLLQAPELGLKRTVPERGIQALTCLGQGRGDGDLTQFTV